MAKYLLLLFLASSTCAFSQSIKGNDPRFNPFATGVFLNKIISIYPDPNGKIVALNDNGFLFRLNDDASLDTSFQQHFFSLGLNYPLKVLQNSIEGGYYVYGNFSERITNKVLNLVKLDKYGNKIFSAGTVQETIVALAQQKDGNVIAAVEIQTSSYPQRVELRQLSADGSLVKSFFSSTVDKFFVKKVLIQSNDQILLVGEFNINNGYIRKVISLNTQGKLDPSFTVSLKSNEVVTDAEIDENDQLV